MNSIRDLEKYEEGVAEARAMLCPEVVKLMLTGKADKGTILEIGFSEEEISQALNTLSLDTVLQYERVIYYSKESECWIVAVPELLGCQADGKTMREAMASADGMIREWIETAISLNSEIPVPQGKVPFEV